MGYVHCGIVVRGSEWVCDGEGLRLLGKVALVTGGAITAVSAFQVSVGLSGTTNKTVKLPKNFSLLAPGPGYTCGPATIVPSTVYLTPGRRRKTQALMTWNITCTYSQFLVSKHPRCCVSFSSFYNQTITPCPTCSCGYNNKDRCIKSDSKRLSTVGINTTRKDNEPLLKCTHHMYLIRVHRHKAIEYHEWLLQQEAQPRLTRTTIDHSTIRQFAYGSTADAFDEYLQMSEHTARDALFSLLCASWNCICRRLIVCTENEKNCPMSWQGQYGRGDKKTPTIMLEAVASQDLWIWHAFYGITGANNDINVLDNSSLFDDLLDDLATMVPYVVNGVEYRNGYYLADEMYPKWASFVKSFTVAIDPKHTYVKQRQESAQKDVERAFGVLQ
nr:COBRA-like protein 4 [Tanacetum cinerariifolium]